MHSTSNIFVKTSKSKLPENYILYDSRIRLLNIKLDSKVFLLLSLYIFKVKRPFFAITTREAGFLSDLFRYLNLIAI